jgi:hypothetical protein
MDLMSRKAKFHEVVKDEQALMYHAVKYQSGNRYPLAVMCFQYLQHKAQISK